MEEIQNKFNELSIEELNIDGGVENVCDSNEVTEQGE